MLAILMCVCECVCVFLRHCHFECVKCYETIVLSTQNAEQIKLCKWPIVKPKCRFSHLIFDVNFIGVWMIFPAKIIRLFLIIVRKSVVALMDLPLMKFALDGMSRGNSLA